MPEHRLQIQGGFDRRERDFEEFFGIPNKASTPLAPARYFVFAVSGLGDVLRKVATNVTIYFFNANVERYFVEMRPPLGFHPAIADDCPVDETIVRENEVEMGLRVGLVVFDNAEVLDVGKDGVGAWDAKRVGKHVISHLAKHTFFNRLGVIGANKAPK